MKTLKNLKKALILILLIISLQGCGVLLMEDFDNNEYQITTELRTSAIIAQGMCQNNENIRNILDEMSTNSLLLKNYTEYIWFNEDSHKMASSLHSMIINTQTIYKNEEISELYCKEKFKSIELSSAKIQKVLGGKPR